jgi:ribonuclease D
VAGLPAFAGRGARRHLPTWQRAVTDALELPDAALPPVSAPTDGPPPPRAWPDRDPAAASRLAAVRAGVAAVAAEVEMPTENVLAPDTVKRVCWRPPEHLDVRTVTDALRDLGARPWQVELTTAVVLTGLATAG